MFALEKNLIQQNYVEHEKNNLEKVKGKWVVRVFHWFFCSTKEEKNLNKGGRVEINNIFEGLKKNGETSGTD